MNFQHHLVGQDERGVALSGANTMDIVRRDHGLGAETGRGRERDSAALPRVQCFASPLVAGPGAIATAMVLARQHGSTGGRAAVVIGILAAVAVIGVTLLAAEFLTRRVPPAAVHFLTRVLGLLLAAIGVELVLRGVHGAFPG